MGGELLVVVRTLLALLGVCALAWLVLSALARRGIGVGARALGTARLQVIERVTLAPRRQVYLVRADARLLVVGAGEGGALSLLAELPVEAPREVVVAPAATSSSDARPGTRFEA